MAASGKQPGYDDLLIGSVSFAVCHSSLVTFGATGTLQDYIISAIAYI